MLESLGSDLRFGARTLWKSRAFSAIAIITLALGVGASTAIFDVIDNVLLEPFPYKDAQRLMSVMIHNLDDSNPGGRASFTGPEFLDYVSQNHVFEDAIANAQEDILYTSGEGAERFQGAAITPNTFEFFGMKPLIGRAAQAADYEPGAPPTFVLRYKTWVSRFNSDPSLINKTFTLNGVSRTLIGIMPPRFAWGDADMWIPEKPVRTLTTSNGFPRFWFLLGHLKPGVTREQAVADFTVIAKQLAPAYPSDYPTRFSIQIQSLAELVVGQFRTTLFIVLAAVGLLLLIGCGNVANLLLARATTREKEFAVRAALGAGRRRLIQQLLVESFLLAIGAAVLGSLFAWAGLKGLTTIIPPNIIPAESSIHMNGPALMFTLAVAVLTVLIFGLAPALQASRRNLNDSLRDSSKGTSGGSSHANIRNAVIVFEVALSLTLLIGAGLLMRSFTALHEVKLGLRPDHILVARLPLPQDRYKTAAQVAGFFRPLLQRLNALPGVVSASETSTLPPYGGIPSDIEVPGKVHTEKWTSLFQLCSEQYFTVLRIQFVRGRAFTESEVNNARKLVVINQTFQRKYFGDEDPIGKRIHILQLEKFPDSQPTDAWYEVIGIVDDVKNQGLQDPIIPETWIPYTVTGSAFRGVLVRTAGDPLLMMNAMRQAIWGTDRNVALTFTGTMESFINSFSYSQPRFGFLLVTVFALVGVVLVSIGVYSVIAYTTARRTHEIGIRMALGANGGDVQRLVIRTGLRLVALGIVIGLCVSFVLSRMIASQLWGVSAHDPVTLIVVPFLLLIIGVLACWIPARRATHVSPVIALRYE
jgi:putative ABC transport system permease protein